LSKSKNIILGVAASIAIYKACEIIRRLKEQGFSVTVVMTEDATELIRPLVFESLSGNKVHYKMFEEAQNWDIEHVALADKADLILVAPATANIIGKIASGICDDLLTCTICAADAPVLICPAMNEGMYKNRIVQDNITRLNKFGYKFVEPRVGKLACGKVGVGCLASVEIIIKQAIKYLK
jgi:phosphopantothenoylcysteine decarboxylase / phosphopantothenate---cysteine ligase